MKKYTIFTAVVVASFLVLGACSTPAPTQVLPKLTFLHLAPMKFDVVTVEIDIPYKAPNDRVYIEDQFPTSPANAIRTWAIERLKPVGNVGSGTLRIVINQASVREHDLKLDKSFKGAFTKQQSIRYDMNIDVALELIDGAGKKVGFSAAKVDRSITTREDISLNDRDKRWFETTEKAMEDFNREMEANILQYLAGWLR